MGVSVVLMCSVLSVIDDVKAGVTLPVWHDVLLTGVDVCESDDLTRDLEDSATGPIHSCDSRRSFVD